jgi:type II secretory pathway predicted ATPase ExeA
MPEKNFIERVYRLRKNPFANWVDPDVEMAGRKTEKARWEDIIQRRKGGKANSMCFITGDYGMGKTLTLQKIVEQYQADASIWPVYLKMLSEDRAPKFGVDFIQRIFRQIPQDNFRRLDLDQINSLRPFFPEPAKVLGHIQLNVAEAYDFLCGSRPFTPAEMKRLGIQHKIDNSDLAKKYLLCFLYAIAGIGEKTLLLAIDETEYVFSQLSGAGIAQVWNSLRDLYDLQNSPAQPTVSGVSTGPANMIFFFGISTGGWAEFQSLLRREQSRPGPVQPLMRRLEGPIQLQPLSKLESRELITKRLSRDRVKATSKAKLLIPFDETFVKLIYEKSLGNPSEIVKFCDFALEDGLRDGIEILDAEYASKVFTDRGLILDE